MPDRNLREQSHALPGRFGSIEARLRALSVRTWPGAMRTGSENLYNPVDATTFNTLIEVVTLPGRWLAMGQFDLSCPNPSGDADFEFRLAAFDVETGTQQTGPAF